MISVERFYDAVLPSTGVYCHAYWWNGSMKHTVCQNKTDFINAVGSTVAVDTYFGVSTYAQGWHLTPTPTNPNKQSFRVASNTIAQKSLWLDFDVGAEDNKYPTIEDARDALEKFLTETKLPRPIRVCSGGGIHVYWSLDQEVSTDLWLKVARRMKALTKSLGVKVDQSRTADCASILRCPGTYNYKQETPRPVTIEEFNEPSNTKDLFLQIKNLTDGMEIESPATTSSLAPMGFTVPPHIFSMMNTYGLVAEDPLERVPEAKYIIEQCQQVREAGLHEEPVWYGMMTVVNRCRNGAKAIHILSKVDKRRYSEYDTDQKINQVNCSSQGPMRCGTFNTARLGVCTNCPFWGSISSPIELGYGDKAPQKPTTITTPLPPPAVVDPGSLYTRPDGHITLSDFGCYKHENGSVIHLTWNKKLKDYEPELLFRYMPTPLYILEEIVNKVVTIYYVWEVTNNGQVDIVKMEHSILSSKARIHSFLTSIRLQPPPLLYDQGAMYMSYYTHKLQESLVTVRKEDKFGWITGRDVSGKHTPHFILGMSMLSANQPRKEVSFSESTEAYAIRTMTPKGTVEGWKKAMSIYSAKDTWAHFGIGLGFAAVLMKFYPDTAQNGIVNFYSNESGSGKTTLQQAIASIWGHPKHQIVKSTTLNARLGTLGLRQNLPMLLDEITNIVGKELSDMVFDIANGTGKVRLDQNSELMEQKYWQTITITSANNKISDKLTSMSSTREGEQMRVLDIDTPPAHMTKEEFDATFSQVHNHHGVVGAMFVQYLLDTEGLLDDITNRLVAKSASISNKAPHRFWANTMGAVLVALEITNEMGITDYDLDVLTSFCKLRTVEQGKSVDNSRMTPQGILSDFLLEKRPHTLIVASKSRPVGKTAPTIDNGVDPYVLFKPSQSNIEVRLEQDTGTYYVQSSAFKEWMSAREHGYSHILNTLKDEGIYKGTDRATLTKNIPYMAALRNTAYVFHLPEEEASI